MRKEWIVKVYGAGQIFFYNSIGAESGPWAWNSNEGRLSDLTGAYDIRAVSEELGENLDAALREGILPAELTYGPDDLKDA